MKSKKLVDVKKIAVLRANALGDFIFVLPALSSLRSAYPDAEIVYFGNPWHKDYLSGRVESVDRFVVVPPSPGVREGKYVERELTRFFEDMRKERFDLAIQLHGGGRYSNPFLLRLAAEVTLGLKTPDAAKLDINVAYDVYQSEYIRYLEVVSMVGGKMEGVVPRLQVLKKDITEAQRFIPDDREFIVIHPGASDIRRRWPTEYFAYVGDHLAGMGYEVVITGVEGEKELGNKIQKKMKASAINLVGKVSLSGLTGLLALSELVIANDTGPLHLADAIGAKTIGIYWCGNGLISAPLLRNDRSVLLSWMINCPLCGANIAGARPFDRENSECQHEASFVKEVLPENVISESEKLLERTNRQFPERETTII